MAKKSSKTSAPHPDFGSAYHAKAAAGAYQSMKSAQAKMDDATPGSRHHRAMAELVAIHSHAYRHHSRTATRYKKAGY